MMRVTPLTLAAANEFVRDNHRHHKPVAGAKFAAGVSDNGELQGVVIVGRPLSRMLDDGQTLEVTRVCTKGARNACSKLYGIARRVSRELGYSKLITYTLPKEGGASLRGSGWRPAMQTRAQSWHRDSRPRPDYPEQLEVVKQRWEVDLIK